MLNQEEIYQLLSQRQFTVIIQKLVHNREIFKQEPALAHTMNFVLPELFSFIQRQTLTEDIRLDLDKLLIMHAQNYYRLPDEYALKLLTTLWNGQNEPIFYEVAKSFPDDPVCKNIISNFNYKKEESHWMINNSQPVTVVPGSQYSTAIKHFENSHYLKVYVRDQAKLPVIATHLNQLSSVRVANVSSQRQNKQDLTVYPRPPYTLTEMQGEVELALDNYFSGSPFDPVFEEEVISKVSDRAYYQFLDHLIRFGKSLERIKDTTGEWDEPRYRNFLTLSLDGLSSRHSVTGETFNHSGKSDILVRDSDKNNLLVAECKIWTGEQALHQAIDQLFERYVHWRDEKTALIVFNKSVKGFTQLVDKAVSTVKEHPLCYSLTQKRTDQSFSFIFRNVDDPEKLVKFELVLFNFC